MLVASSPRTEACANMLASRRWVACLIKQREHRLMLAQKTPIIDKTCQKRHRVFAHCFSPLQHRTTPTPTPKRLQERTSKHRVSLRPRVPTVPQQCPGRAKGSEGVERGIRCRETVSQGRWPLRESVCNLALTPCS